MSESYPQYSRDNGDHEHKHMEMHDHDHDHEHEDEHEMHNPQYEMIVETIQDCEATCEHMIHHIIKRPDLEMRRRQLTLLHDCADICTLTAKYIARKSVFSKHMANLCAFVCHTCGRECAKFRDEESQDCARICMHCARECREFAMSRD